MGLADDQLPIYIYNMRRLGYPPGHFQALTDDSSGIAMFGNDGRGMVGWVGGYLYSVYYSV